MGHDPQRGHINGVTFKNITVTSPTIPVSRLTGCDAAHQIENVTFDHVIIGRKLASSAGDLKLQMNAFVKNVRFLAK